MTFAHARAPRSILVLAILAVAASACGSGGSRGDGEASGPTPTSRPTLTASTAATGGPGSPTPGATPSGTLPLLHLTELARGFDRPLFVTAAPGDATRLFVVEQTGRIRVVTGDVVRAQSFLDLSATVSCCGERGLLGLAFHPDYASNGRFFVNYTDAAGNTAIAEYGRADPEVAEPAARRTLLTVEQPFANHNGGMLAFGPDGFLYVGLGDGGGTGDPQHHGQSLATKLGKILRVDVDRYPAPAAGNVEGGDPDIWDFGLRNPWRITFDRATGDLYVADVGQELFEEVDVEPRGDGRRNYGWSVTEGRHCFEPPRDCDPTGITLPVVEYDHTEGCAVVGGYVYRGTAIPELTGRYFFSDFCSNRIRTFVYADGAATDPRDLTPDLDPDSKLVNVTSFGEDAAGEILLVDQAGIVFRIDRE